MASALVSDRQKTKSSPSHSRTDRDQGRITEGICHAHGKKREAALMGEKGKAEGYGGGQEPLDEK